MTLPLHTLAHELTRLLKRLNAAEYNSVAVSTAATMLDTSRTTIERMVVSGDLQAFWLKGEKRILLSSVSDYVERHRIVGKGASKIRVGISSVKSENSIRKTG